MSTKVNVEGIGNVELTYSERGQGHPVLLLHGGAGPMSVVPWAELLGRSKPARVITPTHPGFMGTPRPEALKDVRGLAHVYAAMIKELKLEAVTVIGNSIGGWIAAELALAAPTLVKKLVLVDAVGIEVPGHPVADVFTMPLDELSRLSYHDPQRFRIDPSKLTPAQKAAFGANRATLKVYASNPMDPGLRPRLHELERPTLVVWGEADGVVDGDYGRAYASAIPKSKFQMLAGTGHVPQVETPELLMETIWPFITA